MSSNMIQSRLRSNLSTQIMIQINKLDWVWIRTMQDPVQVLREKFRSVSQLKRKSEQSKIWSKYSYKDLDQLAGSGMNSSKAKSDLSTQMLIKIQKLAQAQIRVVWSISRYLEVDWEYSEVDQGRLNRIQIYQVDRA